MSGTVLTPTAFALQFGLQDAGVSTAPVPTPNAVYTASANDRWDLVAWKVYGDVSQIPLLIANNPTLTISCVIPAGTQIFAPVIAPPAATPPFLWPP